MTSIRNRRAISTELTPVSGQDRRRSENLDEGQKATWTH